MLVLGYRHQTEHVNQGSLFTPGWPIVLVDKQTILDMRMNVVLYVVQVLYSVVIDPGKIKRVPFVFVVGISLWIYR